MPSDKTVAVLFGSGISIPADMPSTGKITERVISGEGIIHNTNETYSFGERPNGKQDEYVPRVIGFLKRLEVEVDRYYGAEYSTNYEDLYYVASQIYDSLTGNYDNPAVLPLIEKISPDIEPLLVPKENEIKQDWEFLELAREATNYIRDVVWHMLWKEPCGTDYLHCIRDGCLDTGFRKVDIFTLNHDTVLERCLSQDGIEINDGFGNPINDVRYWNPDLFETKDCRVRLFKLHGSVNWFRFRVEGGGWGDESIGIPVDRDFWYVENPYRQMLWPADGRPMFLAGTFNKILQYTSGIYADLHYQMLRSLRHCERLIICGYGFGDKGINTRIVEWMYFSSNNKITIIHRDPESLKRRARGAISGKWDEWMGGKKLAIIPKLIETTSWKEIRR